MESGGWGLRSLLPLKSRRCIDTLPQCATGPAGLLSDLSERGNPPESLFPV